MGGLGLRTISGVLLLAAVIGAIFVKGLPLMAMVGMAAGVAAHEFYSICRRAGYRPFYQVGVALTLLLALRAYLSGDLLAGGRSSPGAAAELMAVVLVVLVVFAGQGLGWHRAPSVAVNYVAITIPEWRADLSPAARSPYLAWTDMGLALGGALYIGGLLGLAPLISGFAPAPGAHGPLAGGTGWLLMALLGTTACDTGAYLVGSLLGKHKMIPRISPGKTWEGLAGGAVASVIAAIALSGALDLDPAPAVVLGLLICAAAVAGDLCESLLKRAAGVKDSGRLIPGHGGLLDRIDSILFVLGAIYVFATIFRKA